MSISFKSIENLASDLEKMGSSGLLLQDEALTAGAEILKAEEQKRAPVYRGSPRIIRRTTASGRKEDARELVPGFLRDHMAKLDLRTDNQGRRSIAVGLEKGDISQGFYGKFSEYGTSHQPAKPWIRPSFDAVVNKIEMVIMDILFSGIEKFFKGG